MILAFAGQKGGAGKTTAAVCCAVEWVCQGKKVLLVDADPQGSSRTWGEVANEGGHPAPTIVAMGADLHKPGQLPALAASFDIAIIDCPPRHGEIQRAALMVADLVVLPVAPSGLETWALGESLDLVSAAQVLRPDLKAVLLLSRMVPKTTLGAGARKALSEIGVPLLSSVLHFRIAYNEALAAGQGVTRYAARSIAAEEIRALVKELEGLLLPQEQPQERKTNGQPETDAVLKKAAKTRSSRR